jgi:hypothetical protein
MTPARQPRGIPVGGQFAPAQRSEPFFALSTDKADITLYHRFTSNGMDRTEQRNVSRRLVKAAYDSGLLLKMVGARNIDDVAGVLSDSRDNAKLDAAIHAVSSYEQRNPGTVNPDSIGFQICRRLLQARRATPAR